jgi:hypothetical protein
MDLVTSDAEEQVIDPRTLAMLKYKDALDAMQAADRMMAAAQPTPNPPTVAERTKMAAEQGIAGLASRLSPGIQQRGNQLASQELQQAMGGGLPQLPAPNMARMAGGGIVAFQDGGSTRLEKLTQQLIEAGMEPEAAREAAQKTLDRGLPLPRVPGLPRVPNLLPDPTAPARAAGRGLASLYEALPDQLGGPRDEDFRPAGLEPLVRDVAQFEPERRQFNVPSTTYGMGDRTGQLETLQGMGSGILEMLGNVVGEREITPRDPNQPYRRGERVPSSARSAGGAERVASSGGMTDEEILKAVSEGGGVNAADAFPTLMGMARGDSSVAEMSNPQRIGAIMRDFVRGPFVAASQLPRPDVAGGISDFMAGVTGQPTTPRGRASPGAETADQVAAPAAAEQAAQQQQQPGGLAALVEQMRSQGDAPVGRTASDTGRADDLESLRESTSFIRDRALDPDFVDSSRRGVEDRAREAYGVPEELKELYRSRIEALDKPMFTPEEERSRKISAILSGLASSNLIAQGGPAASRAVAEVSDAIRADSVARAEKQFDLASGLLGMDMQASQRAFNAGLEATITAMNQQGVALQMAISQLNAADNREAAALLQESQNGIEMTKQMIEAFKNGQSNARDVQRNVGAMVRDLGDRIDKLQTSGLPGQPLSPEVNAAIRVLENERSALQSVFNAALGESGFAVPEISDEVGLTPDDEELIKRYTR